MNMQFTEHFSFWELTDSSHKELVEGNREEAKAYINNLKRLARQLEIIRMHYKKAVVISSGFRGPSLNKAVGSKAKKSQHLVGLAADLQISGISADKILLDIKNKTIQLTEGCKVIVEKVGGKVWIHLGLWEIPSKRFEFLKTKDGIHYELV